MHTAHFAAQFQALADHKGGNERHLIGDVRPFLTDRILQIAKTRYPESLLEDRLDNGSNPTLSLSTRESFQL